MTDTRRLRPMQTIGRMLFALFACLLLGGWSFSWDGEVEEAAAEAQQPTLDGAPPSVDLTPPEESLEVIELDPALETPERLPSAMIDLPDVLDDPALQGATPPDALVLESPPGG